MKIECTRCGRQMPCTATLPLVCGCGHRHRDQSELRQTESPPGIVTKLAKVTTAYAKWKAAGSPVRTEEEVAAIKAICEACPLFSSGTCGQCGCNVQRKAEWATERCPVGKWPNGDTVSR